MAKEFDSALSSVAEARVPLQGSGDLSGTLYLRPLKDGVALVGFIDGLPPGQHAIHVHEYGDCSGVAFAAAGGHLNPKDKPHAAPYAEDKHMGDMGNLTTNERGVAIFGMHIPGATLDAGDDNTLIGKAVIVHEGVDDMKTQPDGAAGKRIACGVIRAGE